MKTRKVTFRGMIEAMTTVCILWCVSWFLFGAIIGLTGYYTSVSDAFLWYVGIQIICGFIAGYGFMMIDDTGIGYNSPYENRRDLRMQDVRYTPDWSC